ncbi:MAG: DEAD/DEAH box helicase family protein [Romboutsia sp.]
MHGIVLKEFQEKCVNELIDECISNKNDEIVVKAPTGSGKTIMLINFIERYVDDVSKQSIFIWLTPGTGELEEQSKSKMNKYLPEKDTKLIIDVLKTGFNEGDTVFINWESVNKKGNTAIKEQERKNLFDRIDEAKNNNFNFIVIIDEEHINQTIKSEGIIRSFYPKQIIRASATPIVNKKVKMIQVDEIDVIKEGLICKKLYINEGVEGNTHIENEHEYLINLALEKRKDMHNKYKKNGLDINPLIIIQLPNGEKSELLVPSVELYLQQKGFTYDNDVAIWLSERKENIDNISLNNDRYTILIMKQAISTGWDCPRAKILVKLRDNMSEIFETQIIGRIRRMPKARHYENELTDNCFLYTFDTKYTEIVKSELGDNASECKLIYLKEEYKGFKLIKEYKNNESDEHGSRDAFESIYEHLKNKYTLSSDKKQNRIIFESKDFIFGTELKAKIVQGNISNITAQSIQNIDTINIYEEVNTHKNGIDMKHAIGSISSKVGMKYDKMRKVLERLFMYKKNKNKGILNLNRREFYAFVINNEKKLKVECIEALSKRHVQQQFDIPGIREEEFSIPEIDMIMYNPNIRDPWIIRNNVYENYPSNVVRSNPETKFERYCEDNNNVEWIYKNGESSQQYFSIVYVDILNKQWSFYPDYILKLKDSSIWIIEAKGGEDKYGNSKNIDIKVENKFEALKRYGQKHNINWGFVRDYDANQKLYLNNTIYNEDMNDLSWVKIEDIF